MPETTPAAKGPAPVTIPTSATEPEQIPTEKVNPEDIATLTLEYRDGWPVLVATDGTYIPGELPVLDSAGNITGKFAPRKLVDPQQPRPPLYLTPLSLYK
ncbi:hypothetical protein [Streptomyces vinaceus]|uniref:hypothetical protein n=1 Tax=Streptomyces vinaceus TaxID=1960 RepID=UPI0036916ED9